MKKDYWCGGMGLHKTQLDHIEKIISEYDIQNIVEFGSGMSTQFLVDLREEKELGYQIYSFDHHPQYAYKGSHDFLNLTIKELVQCGDDQFNEMFIQKKYDSSFFLEAQQEIDNFRAKNCFYNITTSDLPRRYWFSHP